MVKIYIINKVYQVNIFFKANILLNFAKPIPNCSLQYAFLQDFLRLKIL